MRTDRQTDCTGRQTVQTDRPFQLFSEGCQWLSIGCLQLLIGLGSMRCRRCTCVKGPPKVPVHTQACLCVGTSF